LDSFVFGHSFVLGYSFVFDYSDNSTINRFSERIRVHELGLLHFSCPVPSDAFLAQRVKVSVLPHGQASKQAAC
jgi:hypothetical protein